MRTQNIISLHSEIRKTHAFWGKKIVQVNKKRGVFLVIKKERRRIMFTNTAMVLMLTMVGISTICGCSSLMGRR